MNRIFITLVLCFCLIGAFLVYQAGKSGTSRVLLPSQLLARQSEAPLTRIQVVGRVKEPISYEVKPEMVLEFQMTDPDKTEIAVPVTYRGLKPDMFAAGRDVIIDGEFQGGRLTAHRLQTQCPSKYEPPKVGETVKASKGAS